MEKPNRSGNLCRVVIHFLLSLGMNWENTKEKIRFSCSKCLLWSGVTGSSFQKDTHLSEKYQTQNFVNWLWSSKNFFPNGIYKR